MLTAHRIVVWPIVGASYASLVAALIHLATSTWSGAASLGVFFSVFLGAPSMIGYAGYLWRKKLLHGFARYEATVCAAFPALLLGLAALALLFGRK